MNNLFNFIFKNIGKKFMMIGKILVSIGLILSIVLAIFYFVMASVSPWGRSTNIIYGVLWLVLGPLCSIVYSWALYMAGQEVDDIRSIRCLLENKTEKDAEVQSMPEKKGPVKKETVEQKPVEQEAVEQKPVKKKTVKTVKEEEKK